MYFPFYQQWNSKVTRIRLFLLLFHVCRYSDVFTHFMYTALGLWVLKLEKWTFLYLFLFKKIFNFSKILCIWVFFLARTCACLVPREVSKSLGPFGTIVYIVVSWHMLPGAEHRSSGLLTTEQMFRPDSCLFFDVNINNNYLYQYLMTFLREI